MRVGVNLLPLAPGRVGGIKQHVIMLLHELQRLSLGFELICYVNSRARSILEGISAPLDVVELPWGSGEIEARARAGEFDVLFGALMESGLKTPCCPTVTLLADLQHVDCPENFSSREIRRRRLRWEWAAKASQRVGVSTDFVARSVAAHLRVPPQHIFRAPPPLPMAFRQEPSSETLAYYREEVRRRLPERFLLFPGNTWPHKNHIRLLQAVASVGPIRDPVQMVFTGWEMGAHGAMTRAVARLGLRQHVHWIGYVPDECMPLLYRDATALIFPSLYEGFGIPLLEAMNAECPIACSNTTACPEIVGNAAILFDPTNVEQIACAIRQLWERADVRASLVQAGRARRSAFDPAAGARNLAEAFGKAVEEYEDPTKWRRSTQLVSAANEHPLVSIITPSFEHAHYIAETIESVRSQDYPNIEHIVVDGGSTDGTVEILKNYGAAIRWISEPDNGQAHAVNKGLAMAKGEIIGWLNSDDTYLPGAISHAVNALRKKSGSWLVYGEARYTDGSGKPLSRYRTETYSPENLLRYCTICQPTVFFDRRLLEMGGPLDETYRMAMDYELWLRYSRITSFLYVPEILATSRMYPQNKTSRFRFRSIQESRRACRKHYHRSSSLWCRQYGQAIAEAVPVVRSYRFLRMPVAALFFGIALLRDVVPFQLMEMLRQIYVESRG